MGDRLEDLPEGNTQDDPMMDEFFAKKRDVKRSWKDYLKIVGLALVAFALSANPFVNLSISKISLFHGAYRSFAGQIILFLIVFGTMLWYF